MSGFTKLVPEIVMSSIWNESPEVRCVWITMLAIKDEHGIVLGTEETLARIANVTLQNVTDAIERFSSPDKNSRTPDNEGRRIAKYDGGWIVLNHGKYRANDAVLREKTRERVRRFREKKAMEKGSKTGNVTETLPSASASASVSEIKDRVQVEGKAIDLPFGEQFAAAWSEWQVFRREIKKPLRATTIKRQLEFLGAMSEGDAVGAITRSISNGWTGLFAHTSGAKPERPIWQDCAARCRHWDAEKRWCSKFVKTEPKSCEQCKEF